MNIDYPKISKLLGRGLIVSISISALTRQPVFAQAGVPSQQPTEASVPVSMPQIPTQPSYPNQQPPSTCGVFLEVGANINNSANTGQSTQATAVIRWGIGNPCAKPTHPNQSTFLGCMGLRAQMASNGVSSQKLEEVIPLDVCLKLLPVATP
jgi:hypothetical protein